MRRITAALLLLAPLGGRHANAACNLIPSASKAFRGTLGATNRPFAAPGDFVEIGVQAAGCDAASPGLSAQAEDHVVTVAFTPPGNGPRRLVVLAAACKSSQLNACQASPGVASVSCVEVNQPAHPTDLALVERNGERHLAFRFPDTDALVAPDADDRTLSGPAAVAVTRSVDPLPCGLASAPCASQTGLVACIDDLFVADGTCQSTVDSTFPHFTALPPPNDFQADCFADSPPCAATAPEIRLTIDSGGNLLLPVNWQGVLASSQAGVPVPRLVRSTFKSPVPFQIPAKVFLASYTPEGARLPPIFEPQSDPTVAPGSGVVTLFGSADAPSTVLRIARRRGRCASGTNDGQPCELDRDCPGGTCPTACAGGSNDGLPCSSDGECPGGKCGSLFDFAGVAAGGGPLVLPRLAPAICQLEPHQACTGPGDCLGTGNTCVSYALEAETPVPLEGLAGTEDVFSFTVDEAVDAQDRNGDGDIIDSVVTLRDRDTGVVQPLGAPAGCGIAGTPEGRAVVRIRQPPFSFPALAAEGDVLAFLESEAAEKYCDERGDFDRFDSILRVFRLGFGEVTGAISPPLVVDAAPRVNARSLTVSNGLVFYRRPEAGQAPQLTTRVSVATSGAEGNGDSVSLTLSGDGRFVAFSSGAPDLVAADTNGIEDAFVHDRDTDGNGIFDEPAGTSTTRMSVTTAGAQATGTSRHAVISSDGRSVAFESDASDLVAADTNGLRDVFVHDRDTDGNGIFDEPAGTSTIRVSVTTAGAETIGGGSQGAAISADGRFVAFQSAATNLVAGDTNGVADVFVHDRDADGNGIFDEPAGTSTTRVSVTTAGAQTTVGSSIPAISADGRFVAFESAASDLVAGDTNGLSDIFVRDRDADGDGIFDEPGGTSTTRVSVTTAGAEANGESLGPPGISADGRFVAFISDATNLVADSNGAFDVFVHDRETGTTERVSIATGGGQADDASFNPTMSADGRFVLFDSDATNLVPGDGNARTDVFLHDRLTGATERVSVGASAAQGDDSSFAAAVSADGRFVTFDSLATNLVAGDTNASFDVFVRGADTSNLASDLFADGQLDDIVLEVLDAAGGTRTTLCPAEDVAVAGGTAAFLRPESTVGTVACPGGSLNGDSDTSDLVVQFWPGSGAVQNLGLAATALSLSDTYLAALVSESAENNTDLNGDSDTNDAVVEVHPAGAGSWVNTQQAADTVQVCGSVVVFITPEAAQGADLNGDGDQSDRVLQVFDADTSVRVNVGQAAEEFVCGSSLVAFRTREAAQGENLNGGAGDTDTNDDVLQVYDIGRPECLTVGHPADCLGNSRQAVTPCRLDACDPRIPYRVLTDSVKFLTTECDQGGAVTLGCASGGTDLNGDRPPDAADLVIQVFDPAAGTTKTVGTVFQGSTEDPLQGGEVGGSGGTVYVSSGRCIETLGGSCTTNGECGSGAVCEAGSCQRDQGVCVSDADCPPGVPCQPEPIVPASPDSDDDGVPDHLDDCPSDPNGDQLDTDQDGVGDACDLATCGNGLREVGEECDGVDAPTCAGLCLPDCTCICTNTVSDPRASVKVVAKKDSGKISAGMLIGLASYTDEPVTVRLDDADTVPIAKRAVGALPVKGTSGKLWRFKAKGDGLRQVALKDLSPQGFQLKVKAKRWFTAAAANQSAASTRLTVTIGGQCFSHVATKKTD